MRSANEADTYCPNSQRASSLVSDSARLEVDTSGSRLQPPLVYDHRGECGIGNCCGHLFWNNKRMDRCSRNIDARSSLALDWSHKFCGLIFLVLISGLTSRPYPHPS